jgi:hypothetical protein
LNRPVDISIGDSALERVDEDARPPQRADLQLTLGWVISTDGGDVLPLSQPLGAKPVRNIYFASVTSNGWMPQWEWRDGHALQLRLSRRPRPHSPLLPRRSARRRGPDAAANAAAEAWRALTTADIEAARALLMEDHPAAVPGSTRPS